MPRIHLTLGLAIALLAAGCGTKHNAPEAALIDTDGDGIPDHAETGPGRAWENPDDPYPDGDLDVIDATGRAGDSLQDGFEQYLIDLGASAPVTTLTDSDGDGIPDWCEVFFRHDPQNPDSPLYLGGSARDHDDSKGPPNDGISDALEQVLIQFGASAPVTLASDSDGDGSPDYFEARSGSDPFDPDSPTSDGEGAKDDIDATGPVDRISDALEQNLIHRGAIAPVTTRTDSDGDGLYDYIEVERGSDPFDGDSPLANGGADGAGGTGFAGDGISDALEDHLVGRGASSPIGTHTDSDSDGIPDYFELAAGTDPFAADDPVASGGQDSDDSTGPAADGISDALEQALIDAGASGPITTSTDSDMDGFSDHLEVLAGSDPFDASDPAPGVRDSDGDGIPDLVEIADGSNPYDPFDPLPTGTADSDDSTGPADDGISDALESYLIARGASAPVTTRSDTDADGVPDYFELAAGTSPFDADQPRQDGGLDSVDATGPAADGISDGLEQALLDAGASGPITTATDSDGDGLPDYLEVLAGSAIDDPTDPSANPQADLDGDRIADGLEALLARLGAAQPGEPRDDTDLDGIPDWFEVARGTHPLDPDRPVASGGADADDSTGPAGDGISDALERALLDGGASAPITTATDTDLDGIPDWFEVAEGTDPFDPDAPRIAGGLDAVDASGPAADGISDALEALLEEGGAAPFVTTSTDTDGDGIPDYAEVFAGADPYAADSPLAGGSADANDATGPAGDALSDALEAYLIDAGASAPVTEMSDSDGDLIPDFVEVLLGSDPASGPLPPRVQLDRDGDGLPDYLEVLLGSDRFASDDPTPGGAADVVDSSGPAGDGITDALEAYLVGGGASAPVTPATDTDADGIPDAYEVAIGSDPFAADDPILAGASDVDDTTGPAGDGVPDGLEQILIAGGASAPVDRFSDSDGDGAPDVLEMRTGSDPFAADSPVANGANDSDGDGISDALEQALLAGGASAPVGPSSDSDADGVPDYYEVAERGSDPFDADDPLLSGGSDVVDGTGPAGDGISDALEQVLVDAGSSAPLTAETDTDMDGVPDYFEVRTGSDPFAVQDPVFSGNLDVHDATGPMGDGISDALEQALASLGATAPVSATTDSDGDGVPDYYEVRFGSDAFDAGSPLNAGSQDVDDSTGPAADGISDALEAVLIARGASGPITTATDSDGDTIPDHTEVYAGTDPFDGSSPSFHNPDSDLDGLPDYLELIIGSNFNDPDAPFVDGDLDVIDADGPVDRITDGLEQYLIANGASAPVTTTTDTDLDGVPDWFEVAEVRSSPFDVDSPVAGGGQDVDDSTGPAGDGISDAFEQELINAGASAPITTETDTDNDGVPDYLEVLAGAALDDNDDPLAGGAVDMDGDGIPDSLEQALVQAGASAPVDNRTDTDGDGIPDAYEVLVLHSHPLRDDLPVSAGGADSDDSTGPADDGISDALEQVLLDGGASAPVGTATDTDLDGAPDYFEVRGGSDPFDGDAPVVGGLDVIDATGPAGDGISDALERLLLDGGASAPVTSATDTDLDGLPDYAEVAFGSDPFEVDSPIASGGDDTVDSTGPAGDGVSDALERYLVDSGSAAPVSAATDSDGDDFPDYLEVRSGTDPYDPNDPAPGAPGDSDGDGIPDSYEIMTGSDPYDADVPTTGGGADSNDATGPADDGISDALEQALIDGGATGPITTMTDTDMDGVPDYTEVASGSDPFDADSPVASGGGDTNDSTGPADDGISDALEDELIEGGASGPVTTGTDTDMDGVPDYFEVRTGGDPFAGDDPVVAGAGDTDDSTGPAADGISDALEQALIDGGASGPITTRTDTDLDGVPDYLEVGAGSDPFDADSPVMAGATDSDGDGLSDALEQVLEAGGASAPVTPASDTDGDGIPDAYEVMTGSDPFDADGPLVAGGADAVDATGPAADGISDALEQALIDGGAIGPVTTQTDTDNDGIPDYFEVFAGSDPFDADAPLVDGGDDNDDTSGPAADGISDALEQALIDAGASGPITHQTDSDGDGIPDDVEVLAGGDPFDADSPVSAGALDSDDTTGPGADGIPDGLEQFLIAGGASGPVTTTTDTDMDGIPDFAELQTGTDPFDADDPGSLMAGDFDGDGVPDWFEAFGGSDAYDGDAPLVNGGDDTDDTTGPAGDGISDALEQALIDAGASGPITTRTDTDMDGIPDYFELVLVSDPFDGDRPVTAGGDDTDDTTGPADDGISDALELALLSGGASAPLTTTSDTDNDGVPDWFEVRTGSDPFDADAPLLDGGDDNDDTTGPAADGISDALEQALIDEGASAPVTTLTDSDADGVPDYLEVRAGGDPFDADSPVMAGATDSDGDGLSDALEEALERLGASAPLTAMTDSDSDGVPDWFEVAGGSAPFDTDSPLASGGNDSDDLTGPAADGISDALEQALIDAGASGPVTTRTDSDADGVPDYLEVRAGSGPFDADSPVMAGASDSDSDGISDALEEALVRLGASAPVTPASDTDNDGIPDYYEVAALGSSPVDGDAPRIDGGDDLLDLSGPAGDGISDALEQALIDGGASAPLTAMSDTDNDGVPDYLEVRTGSDPFDADSPQLAGGDDTDDATGPAGDGISDALEQSLIAGGASAPVATTTDTDMDGLPDYVEVGAGSDPFDTDSPLASGGSDTDDSTGPAGDALSDALEAYLVGAGASAPVDETTDSDLDRIPDYLELLAGSDPFDSADPATHGPRDVDGDGVPDYLEVLAGSDLADGDDPVSAGGSDVVDGTGPADALSDALEQTLVDLGATAPVDATTDSDGDGIPDFLEVLFVSDAFSVDSPVATGGDDTDDSTGPAGDGISDALEAYLVARGASSPVTNATDSDGDGSPDWFEVARGTDAFDADSPVAGGGNADDSDDSTGPAGDGISDALEQTLVDGGASAPVTRLSDSDGDGAPDYLEVAHGSDPFSADSPLAAGDVDSDGDGLSDNLEEVLLRGGASDPVDASSDSDEDGIPDWYEVALGEHPLDGDQPLASAVPRVDTNDATGPADDGISDALEQALIGEGASSPVTAETDSDGDGAPDAFEVFRGSDPFDADSPVAGGGNADDSDDSSGPAADGLSDALELLLVDGGASAPLTTLSDTDNDGVPDYAEVFRGSDPFDADSPLSGGGGVADNDDGTGSAGDRLSDALEQHLIDGGASAPVEETSDSDGDGIPDFVEVLTHTDPFASDDPTRFAPGDLDADGVPDYFEVLYGSDHLDLDAPVTSGGDDSDDTTGPAADGISDGLEQALIDAGASGPISAATDTDMDGLPDYAEVRYVSDPFDGDSPLVDGGDDVDDSSGPAADGISDALEAYLVEGGASAPVTHQSDSDGDGIPDVLEVRTGSDPFSADSPIADGGDDTDDTTGPAGDGISDGLEAVLIAGGASAPVGTRSDLDGDGVPDYLEVALGSDPFSADSPVASGATDSDGDGLSDALEAALVAAGASAPVTTRTDLDGDGVPDYYEVLALGSRPTDSDDPRVSGGGDSDDSTGPAGDGISDALEQALVDGGASAPLTTRSDTDGDGLPDAYEVRSGHDPFDGDSPIAGGGADSDDTTGPAGDGISDGLESSLLAMGASAPVTPSSDSDGDGIPDYFEVFLGFDAFDADAPVAGGSADGDSDGLSDALEQVLADLGASAPVSAATDSDGDGIPDFAEVLTNTDPFAAASPGSAADRDTDTDGSPDWFEAVSGSDAYDADAPVSGGSGGADSDDTTGPAGDDVSDALEQNLIAGGASAPVTRTTDTDGDGVPDVLEVAAVSSPFDVDSPVVSGDGDSIDSTGPAGDGVSDALEAYLVEAGASAPVDSETDSDGDGVPDWFEVRQVGSDPFSSDSPLASGGGAVDSDDTSGPAGDGISDALELAIAQVTGTSPVDRASDSDGDGAPDYLEVLAGSDPDDVDAPTAAGDTDSDGDGLSDALEAVLVRLGATAPVTTASDTDTDGVPDWFEIAHLRQPLDADDPLSGGANASDDDDLTGPGEDGISDALEDLLIALGASAPVTTASDTDTDGIADWYEVVSGTDPFDADAPLSGGGARNDSDDTSGPDGDLVSDALEALLAAQGASVPVRASTDSDGDGSPDWFEVLTGSAPFDADEPVSGGSADANDATGPADVISDAFEASLLEAGSQGPAITTATDSDGDAIPDFAEVLTGTDAYDAGDPGVHAARDRDGDGVPDYLEVLTGSDPFDGDSPLAAGGADTDDTSGPADDGISDALEQVLIGLGASAPLSSATDSDGDGIPDGLEALFVGDPQSSDVPFADGSDDEDGDGISDAVEQYLVARGASAPIEPATDSDTDGVPDYFELRHGSDPFDADLPLAMGGAERDTTDGTGSAGDGISDALEQFLIDLNPSLTAVERTTDGDGDGAPDYLEVLAASDPFDATSPAAGGAADSDGDSIPDGLEATLVAAGGDAPVTPATDSDGDGIPDYWEVRYGDQPFLADDPLVGGGSGSDSDDSSGPAGDGISDAFEASLLAAGSTGPLLYTATDTDGDGLPDAYEVRRGTDPYDGDAPLASGGDDSDDATGPAGDGISDALEQALIEGGALAPVTTATDSDNDGVADYLEVANGTDPFDSGSFPPTGSAPVATAMLSGTEQVGETLSASLSYSDADGDPEGASSFRWLRDGTPIAGATASTYLLVVADEGAVIGVETTPVSATGLPHAGSPDTAFTGAIAPRPGSPGVASGVAVSGTEQVGETLSGSYSFSDPDGDAEGASTYRWLRDGTPIAGATGTSYALVSADEGAAISFEVTPVSATGTPTTGTPVADTTGAIAPRPGSAPIASMLVVTQMGEVGDTLFATYLYSDADGDLEGASQLAWKRDGTAIPDADTTFYVVTGADLGAVLSFEVTPVALTGTPTVGAAAEATAGAPISGSIFGYDFPTGLTLGVEDAETLSVYLNFDPASPIDFLIYPENFGLLEIRDPATGSVDVDYTISSATDTLKVLVVGLGVDPDSADLAAGATELDTSFHIDAFAGVFQTEEVPVSISAAQTLRYGGLSPDFASLPVQARVVSGPYERDAALVFQVLSEGAGGEAAGFQEDASLFLNTVLVVPGQPLSASALGVDPGFAGIESFSSVLPPRTSGLGLVVPNSLLQGHLSASIDQLAVNSLSSSEALSLGAEIAPGATPLILKQPDSGYVALTVAGDQVVVVEDLDLLGVSPSLAYAPNFPVGGGLLGDGDFAFSPTLQIVNEQVVTTILDGGADADTLLVCDLQGLLDGSDPGGAVLSRSQTLGAMPTTLDPSRVTFLTNPDGVARGAVNSTGEIRVMGGLNTVLIMAPTIVDAVSAPSYVVGDPGAWPVAVDTNTAVYISRDGLGNDALVVVRYGLLISDVDVVPLGTVPAGVRPFVIEGFLGEAVVVPAFGADGLPGGGDDVLHLVNATAGLEMIIDTVVVGDLYDSAASQPLRLRGIPDPLAAVVASDGTDDYLTVVEFGAVPADRQVFRIRVPGPTSGVDGRMVRWLGRNTVSVNGPGSDGSWGTADDAVYIFTLPFHGTGEYEIRDVEYDLRLDLGGRILGFDAMGHVTGGLQPTRVTADLSVLGIPLLSIDLRFAAVANRYLGQTDQIFGWVLLPVPVLPLGVVDLELTLHHE